jgi:isoquinoline 1-oxidoreductase alpha subunit
MPTQSFILNGGRVDVECPSDVRLLWVLRDLLEVHGPKYGCGLMVCKACTCLIEGLAGSVGQELHPMQQAWLDIDVAQCGYCQPGQIMDAVGLVTDIHAKGRQVTEADLDLFRNECRCGTYPRIREAILQGAQAMKIPVHHKPKKKRRPPKRRG